MTRQAQPEIVLEIGLELGRDEAHLREEMAAALAAVAEALRPSLGSKKHRLGAEGAVLGGAEGKRIDATAPGEPAGETPSAVTAFAKRAPSTCNSPFLCAVWRSRGLLGR